MGDYHHSQGSNAVSFQLRCTHIHTRYLNFCTMSGRSWPPNAEEGRWNGPQLPSGRRHGPLIEWKYCTTALHSSRERFQWRAACSRRIAHFCCRSTLELDAQANWQSGGARATQGCQSHHLDSAVGQSSGWLEWIHGAKNCTAVCVRRRG